MSVCLSGETANLTEAVTRVSQKQTVSDVAALMYTIVQIIVFLMDKRRNPNITV
jgi:hypothetical protein